MRMINYMKAELKDPEGQPSNFPCCDKSLFSMGSIIILTTYLLCY